jgi:hypothetical protein
MLGCGLTGAWSSCEDGDHYAERLWLRKGEGIEELVCIHGRTWCVELLSNSIQGV